MEISQISNKRGEIIRTPVLIDLTMCNIGSYQNMGYEKLIGFLKRNILF